MFYEFPKIEHINDVLPAIQGATEFIVADRDAFKVVNYVVATPDTFPQVTDRNSAIRRECRGIIFDKDGNIISRRLHKFFNVNERDETASHLVDLSVPHKILEKLDGSMITPIFVGSMYMRWGTKMGITDVSMNAETFVATKKNYDKFAWQCHLKGLTPIFEWCSRKNRIVVDYPEDRLVLIAMRDTVSGEYAPMSELKHWADKYDLDLVKEYPGTTSDMMYLINETRASEDIEGWVVRFDAGQMIKIKGDWYVKIHKAKDDIGSEKKVLQLLFSDNIDDIKSMLPVEDKFKLQKFEMDVAIGTANFRAVSKIMYLGLVSASGTRKEFAKRVQHFAKTLPKSQGFYATLFFKMYDVFGEHDPIDINKHFEIIRDIQSRNINSQEKIDNIRFTWGDHKWD